jgi:hypothetical protein
MLLLKSKCVLPLVFALALLTLPVIAQDGSEAITNGVKETSPVSTAQPQPVAFRRVFFDFGIGGFTPGRDLKSDYQPILNAQIVAGIRPVKHAAVEIGTDFGFGAGKTNRVISTTGGNRSVGDYAAILYVGGRVILPNDEEKLLLSLGGGYSRLQYGETVNTRQNETVTCISCTRRSGNGYYGMMQAGYYFGETRRLGLTSTLRFVQGTTRGDFLTSSSTNDSWFSATLGLSVRF